MTRAMQAVSSMFDTSHSELRTARDVYSVHEMSAVLYTVFCRKANDNLPPPARPGRTQART